MMLGYWLPERTFPVLDISGHTPLLRSLWTAFSVHGARGTYEDRAEKVLMADVSQVPRPRNMRNT